MAAGLGLQAVVFALATSVRTAGQAWLLGAANGAGGSAVMIAFQVSFAHAFGRANLGAITAPAGTLLIVASGVGPFPLSLAFDVAGSYAPAMFAFALTFALSACSVVAVRAPRRRPSRAAPAAFY